jgi:uncharacterized protein (TIGR02594 family)
MPTETKPNRPAPPWYQVALREAGVHEVVGTQDNPRILEYLASCPVAAHAPDHDEIPWCAAFLNWCLREAGLRGTGSRAARSFLTYGVRLVRPVFGCLVVFSADARGPNAGHAALYAQTLPPAVPSVPPLVGRVSARASAPATIKVYGGNQNNRVCVAPYPVGRVLDYRWPPGVPLEVQP